MSEGPTSLGELIELARERHGVSLRKLAAKAQEQGHRIHSTTLGNILNGRYKSMPETGTLRAIAYLAGVEDDVAFAAADQPVPGPPFADELPPGVDHLPPKARKALIEMIRVLVDLHDPASAGSGEGLPPRWEALAADATDPVHAERARRGRDLGEESQESGEEPPGA